MSEMDTIVSEFVEEGTEKVQQLERHLLALEKNPASRDVIVELFRTLHTIKGATSFLGFTKLCGLAHDGEKLLVRLRDGTLACSPEIINALLSLVDAIRDILAEISTTGKEGGKDFTSVANRLVKLQTSA
jgi:two-component system, chemotaxis family, sensor kinase CheA